MADPLLVVIDDDQSEAELLMEEAFEIVDGAIIASTTIEEDQSQSLLEAADLIVVDYNLADLKEAEPPRARNGLALIAVLREYLARRGLQPSFVLISNKLDDLSDLPQDTRSHVLARNQNFEWALTKADSCTGVPLPEALAALADGSQRINRIFPVASSLTSAQHNPYDERASTFGPDLDPDGDADQLPPASVNLPEDDLTSPPPGLRALRDLLALPADTAWTREASRQIEMARPPIYVTQATSLAVPVRRWLLHRVIPYPTFLYGTEHVAARLGLPASTALSLLGDELADWIAPVTYCGVYSSLDGRRFWRVGVEQLVEKLGGGDMLLLHSALDELVGRPLPYVEHPRPVVVLDESWSPEDHPVPPSEAVRVQLDDWPAHAEPARVRRERTSDPVIANMVIEADRGRSVAPQGFA